MCFMAFFKHPKGATKCLIGIKYWIFNQPINNRKIVPLILFHREGRQYSLFHVDEPLIFIYEDVVFPELFL